MDRPVLTLVYACVCLSITLVAGLPVFLRCRSSSKQGKKLSAHLRHKRRGAIVAAILSTAGGTLMYYCVPGDDSIVPAVLISVVSYFVVVGAYIVTEYDDQNGDGPPMTGVRVSGL